MAYVGYGQSADSLDRAPTLTGLNSVSDTGQLVHAGTNPVANWQGLGDFWNLMNAGIMQPYNDQANFQESLLGDQMLQSQMLSGLNANQLQQSAGFDIRGLGLNRESLGIQQGALARQNELLPQQYALQQQGFDIQGRAQQQAANQSQYALNEQATAQGAYTAAGTNVGRTNIQQNLQNQVQSLGLQRQSAELTFKERMAQQQDASKQLGITAKRLDLSEEEVNARLTNALAQLGISDKINSDQIWAEVSKIEQGKTSVFGSMLGPIFAMANLPLASGGNK